MSKKPDDRYAEKKGSSVFHIPCTCIIKSNRRDYKQVQISSSVKDTFTKNVLVVTSHELKEPSPQRPSCLRNKCSNSISSNRQTKCDLKVNAYNFGTPSTSLSRQNIQLQDFRQSLESPDFIVEIGKSRFKCRIQILKKYSQYFKNLENFSKNVVVLCEDCISLKTFSLIYNWMQFNEEDNCRKFKLEDIYSVLTGAVYLKIPALQMEIWKLLCDGTKFSEDVAFMIYKQASEDCDWDVVQLMLSRIRQYFSILANTQEFLNLTIRQLIPLLSSNYITVSSELEVLTAGCKWLVEDWVSRQHYLPDVMKTIRFGLLDSAHLVALKNNFGHNVLSHEFTNRLIDDGIVLNSLKYEYNYPMKDSEEFWRKCNELSVTVPLPRKPA